MYLSQLDCFQNIESVTCQGCHTVFDTVDIEVDDWNFAWDGYTTIDCCMGCFHKFKVSD